MTTTVPPPDVPRSQAQLRALLHGLPGVDQAGAERHAAALATRVVTAGAERSAIDLAIAMVDLTTLEGTDTPGRVRALCSRARRPDPADPSCPPVAAVCVYPSLVAEATVALAGSGVRLASVATAFPSGQAPLAVRLAETEAAVGDGADEIDMVLNRGAFLSGGYLTAYREIAAVRRACGDARLKVILETGELATYDNVRRACWLAMLAGADFVKTSTGKTTPAATLPATLVMLQSVRDFREQTGRRVGVKAAGGIRTAADAVRYLVLVHEIVGDEWLDPAWFRLGASSLLDDLLARRAAMAPARRTGAGGAGAG